MSKSFLCVHSVVRPSKVLLVLSQLDLHVHAFCEILFSTVKQSIRIFFSGLSNKATLKPRSVQQTRLLVERRGDRLFHSSSLA